MTDTKTDTEKATEILQFVYKLLFGLCSGKIEIAKNAEIDSDTFKIRAYLDNIDMPYIVGSGGRIRQSISNLLIIKAKRLSFDKRIDFWIDESEDSKKARS